MPVLWRRRLPPRSRELLRAAGLNAESMADATDLAVCRVVAFHAAKSGRLEAVLAVAERLLANDADYAFVVAFLEDLQAVVSHGAASFATADQVTRLLGPRSSVCWATLTEFWMSVAAWTERSGLSLRSSEDLLAVENEQLRVLLWTTSRSLPTGEKVGIADAVRYEKAGQPPIPGHSHIAAALDALGQG